MAGETNESVVEDILTYSKANNSERKFEITDLDETLQEGYKELKELIDEKQAILEIGTMPTLPVIPFQFLQLAINILSNAHKFSKTGVKPQLSVKAELVKGATVSDLLGLDLLKSYYKISFEVNGMGFDNEYRVKIFQVYQRLHSRSEYSGTGMGLAICKKIVKDHNGIITAESIPNQGATFMFMFLHNGFANYCKV